MNATKAEIKANRYANEQSKYTNAMVSNAFLAGYCKALDDIQAVMGKTATNDISVLMGRILEFIHDQKN